MSLSMAEHKRYARRLVKAAGGLDAAADECRVGASKLHAYGDKNDPLNQRMFMPADVIADLEAKAGKPIYSAALLDSVKHEPTYVEDIISATCSVNEEMGDLQRAVRQALDDHDLTDAEENALLATIDRITGDLTALRATISKAREPRLRAV